jgi:hypothetical protein
VTSSFKMLCLVLKLEKSTVNVRGDSLDYIATCVFDLRRRASYACVF